MRNIRTPKEFADFVFIHQIYKSLSMVACSGKGSPFAANRMWQFSRPLHVTAKASKLYAVTLKCLHTELRKMYQFIFALIRAPQIKIRLLADNEQQARSRFTDGDTLLFVGRINQNPLKNNRTSSTNGNNHSLPKCEDVGSIESTTTIEGNRNPYQCGIFLPKIHSLHVPKKLGALSYIEFAVQMISRNKAEFIRTNKASRSIAVVESVSHPFTGDTLTLTKSIGNPTMKIYPKNNRTSLSDGNNHSLPAFQKVAMISLQSEKVIASREKLNYLSQANDSTPQNRAFFVRDIRTPKEYADFVFNLNPIILSMVERNEPSLTGCFPVVAVSHLVTLYRPTVRSLAVDSENLSQDTAEMIYKFLCINRTQAHFNLCVISLNSTTEEQARLSLSADYRFIAVVARINPQNNRTLATLPTLSVSATQGGANV